jgi:hypothetical protein
MFLLDAFNLQVETCPSLSIRVVLLWGVGVMAFPLFSRHIIIVQKNDALNFESTNYSTDVFVMLDQMS